MPTPAPTADENATPIYGIRSPKGTSKAKDLGTHIGHTAADLEMVLQEFGLPPVVTNNMVIAASSAARDAHFGTPASASTRRALQDSGAQAVRTDLGYTEQYFAGLTDGGANPGGANPAGWYPVAGAKIGGKVLRANNANALGATTWVLLTTLADWSVRQPAKVATAFNGTWVAPIAGMYQVEGQISLTTAVNAYFIVKKNSATAAITGAVMANQAAGFAGGARAQINGTVPLAAGDVLRLAIFCSAAAAWDTDADGSYFGLTFIEPLRQ